MTKEDDYGGTLIAQLTRDNIVRKLFIQGNSPVAISDILGISKTAAATIIKRYRKELKEADLIEWSDHVDLQLDRLNMVEAEAWEAWTKSKKGRNSYEVLKYEDMTEDQRKAIKSANQKGLEIRSTFEWTVRHEKAHGNAQYLNIVMACIRERSKLLGLDKLQDDQAVDDNIPIVAIMVETSQDVDAIESAQKFLAINKIPSTKG